MICDEHNWTDQELPCPHPNCTRGTPGHRNTMQRQRLVFTNQGVTTRIMHYKRKLDGKIYSWELTLFETDSGRLIVPDGTLSEGEATMDQHEEE